ncbi:MAG UNVERIFIED_CONTAM: DUF6314 family protein [Rickettsiaceae bacterium]|jgi:hypothetical protein
MTKSEQVFELIKGLWRINRRIIHKTPIESYMGRGIAAFSLSGNDLLLYHEKINLVNLQTQLEASGHQKYKYRHDLSKDKIVKYFDDEKLFYELHLKSNTAYGEHLCSQDNYKANYLFDSQDRFSLYYEVKGPNKDYLEFLQNILDWIIKTHVMMISKLPPICLDQWVQFIDDVTLEEH